MFLIRSDSLVEVLKSIGAKPNKDLIKKGESL